MMSSNHTELNQYVNVPYTGRVFSAPARLYTARWLSDEVADL